MNQRIRKKPQLGFKVFLIAVCIVLLAVILILVYYAAFVMRGTNNIGTLVNGSYYYRSNRNGFFYCYHPESGERERLLAPWSYSDWAAGEDYLYYCKNDTWYQMDYDTRKKEKMTQEKRGTLYETDEQYTVPVSGEALAHTEQYVFYIEKYGEYPTDLYCYDVENEDSWILYPDMDIYLAEADDNWLFSQTPWDVGKTVCWQIVYESGKPVGLQYMEEFN